MKCENKLQETQNFPGLKGGVFGTFAFWKEVWENLAQYPKMNIAEDVHFFKKVLKKGGEYVMVDNEMDFIICRHKQNTWKNIFYGHKKIRNKKYWSVFCPIDVIPEEHYLFYLQCSKELNKL